MSSSLKYKYTCLNSDDSINDQIKFILRKKCGGTVSRLIMNNQDMGYVQGLIDCEIEGAEELMEILKNGEIELNEEW